MFVHDYAFRKLYSINLYRFFHLQTRVTLREVIMLTKFVSNIVIRLNCWSQIAYRLTEAILQ